MKVFITGATGYIGRALLLKLLEQGDEVRALSRNLAVSNQFKHERLTWVKGTLEDIASLEAGMKGCEGVYHTAAYARVWAKNPLLYHESNVNGTRNMITAAKCAGVKKFILTSTAGVVGAGGKAPVDENFHRVDGFQNEYESTKAMAEDLAIENAGDNMSVCVVRPARVYGPGKDSRSNPFVFLNRTIQHSRIFLLPKGSEAIGSYCYLEDVVNGHLLAMKNGVHGQRYLLGGENLSYHEVIAETIHACNRKIPIISIPFSLFKLYARFELLRAKISDHEPRIVPSWAERFRKDAAISSKKAEKELGYSITPFSIGIRKTIQSLAQQHAL